MATSFINCSIPTPYIQTSFFPKTSQSAIAITKKNKKPNKSIVSCNATNQNPTPGSNKPHCVDRRDVLIGLGGLYGVVGSDRLSLASPIQAPDLTACKDATVQNSTAGLKSVKCCPPLDKITEFSPPSFKKIRYRPAAHKVDADYLAKFTKAMDLMRALPDSDPRSFKQQADIHCAYCNGAYEQVGFPDIDIQVHNSWLFFPFHRLYLYFYERILGNLIGDPDFAMPFWNWDAPAGMPIPAIYVNPNSSLYDEKRNVNHQPPKLIDHNYSSSKEDEYQATSDEDIIANNLKTMYRQVVSNNVPRLFLGEPYRAGDEPEPGAGSLEKVPHIPIHIFCGDKRQPYGEDMGNFYSAGRDPLFYAHHANVDRMWSIWKDLPGKNRTDFTDSDWLDAAFLFYDENANLVRCKVSDCLDSRTLGYDYERVKIPWLQAKPSPRKLSKTKGKTKTHSHGQANAAEAKSTVIRNVFPLVLDKVLSIEIPRTKKSRTKIEKENEVEVLLIEGIQLARDAAVQFDVYVNGEDDETPTGPQDSEFAGSFANLPHNHNEGKTMNTSMRLPITDLLEDLDAESDDNIIVTLVPKNGKGLVTIGNMKIAFVS